MVDPYPPEFGPRREHVPDSDEERRFRRERTLRRVGVTLGALGIVGALLTGTYASLANARTLTIVRDCTDPAGECAQRNQRATAVAISSIDENAKRTAALAAACAAQVPDPTDPQMILRCMNEYLGERARPTTFRP